jgi:predicted lipid-binding transport protein (Tim44 family)
MKAKGLQVLGATVLYWALQATAVLARGGGAKGGSYSKVPSGGGFSGGGSLGGGGIGGGLFGGGYSRGFFPFFFFGSGGGIFSSLLTLIILGAIALFIFRLFMRRRYSNSREAGNESYGQNQGYSSTPVDFEGKVIKNERSRFGKAINYTRQNMEYYAEKFPRWDRGVVEGRVKQVFYFLQDGWSRQDLSEGTEYLTANLLADYQAKLSAMKGRGERNIIHDPELSSENIDFVYSQLSPDGESFVAKIFASLVDYTVDSSNRIIAGEDDNRLYFNEFWEFIWNEGSWKLAAIYQEDSIEAARWARVDNNM